jgi:hypothetical protein
MNHASWAKITKNPFSGIMERATDLLEIIHIDVCGPASVATRGGYHYFLTFTNIITRYGYIYLMKHKSKTFEKFRVKWKIIVTRKLNFYIGVVLND